MNAEAVNLVPLAVGHMIGLGAIGSCLGMGVMASKFLEASACAASAGSSVSMASSDQAGSCGAPKTVTVVMKRSSPTSLLWRLAGPRRCLQFSQRRGERGVAAGAHLPLQAVQDVVPPFGRVPDALRQAEPVQGQAQDVHGRCPQPGVGVGHPVGQRRPRLVGVQRPLQRLLAGLQRNPAAESPSAPRRPRRWS